MDMGSSFAFNLTLPLNSVTAAALSLPRVVGARSPGPAYATAPMPDLGVAIGLGMGYGI